MLVAVMSALMAERALHSAMTRLIVAAMLKVLFWCEARVCNWVLKMFQTPGGRTPENTFICWITVPGLANRPYIESAAVRPGKTDSNVYIASPPATSVTLSVPSRLKTRQVISHQPRGGISSGCFALRPRLEEGALDS